MFLNVKVSSEDIDALRGQGSPIDRKEAPWCCVCDDFRTRGNTTNFKGPGTVSSQVDIDPNAVITIPLLTSRGRGGRGEGQGKVAARKELINEPEVDESRP